MDPMEGVADKTSFETELDLLLSSPASSLPFRKRSAVEQSVSSHHIKVKSEGPPQKRIKTVQGAAKGHNTPTSDILNVHPARRLLLQIPEAQDQIKPPEDPTTAQQQGQTWKTLGNTVKRQWDPRKDDLDYEFLLEQRRRERVSNVDRYVPMSRSERPRKPRGVFPLQQLPEDIRARIFDYTLVSTDPITIDFYWLLSFVRGHARVPTVMQSVDVHGSTYSFPMGWNELLPGLQTMKNEMVQFKQALEMREAKTRYSRSPCRGLSTSLLRVSRKIHKTAAQVFYSKNTFKLPSSTDAWIQLDSFLVTIGAQNAAKIQHLQIHVPMWHRLIQEDFVDGAVIDSLSPATRMGVIQPAARDRVLSAIRNAVHLLSPTIKTLALELVNSVQADLWTGRCVNDRRFIAASATEEHVNRKSEGVGLLNQLSELLAVKSNRPVLSIARLPKGPRNQDVQAQVANIKKEAAIYGWQY